MASAGSIFSIESPNQTAVWKGVLWKCSIIVSLVVLGFLMWQCGSAFVVGRSLSNVAVQHFHDELNREQYEQIFTEADDAFQRSASKSEMIKVLDRVHTRLDTSGQQELLNFTVTATLEGTYIVVDYTTKFEHGEATEQFTWSKSGGRLKLHDYHIESNAFVIG